MFYDRFVFLCDQKNISPSAAAMEAGISKSLISKWKKDPGIVPTVAVMEKLSKYFSVSISELLDENEQKNKPAGAYPGRLSNPKYDLLTDAQKSIVDSALDGMIDALLKTDDRSDG